MLWRWLAAGLLAARLALACAPAHAANVICPTMPPGDSSNACASTAFVQAAAGGGSVVLPQNQILVGNASNVAAGVAMAGDCTIVAAGTVTCLKTNGTAFAALATLGAGTGLGSSGGNLNLQPAAAATIGGVQSKTCAASNWISTISTAGVETCTQPAFSDLTGQATLAQLPTIATSTVLGNFSGGNAVPSAASVPTCANDGSHALTNDSGSGFNCEVIAAGGTVTSVSAGTGMSFSTITAAGSVAIDKANAANFEAGTASKVLTADNVFIAETTTTYGTTTTFDFSTFFNTAVTLTGNITTVTCSNQKAGQAGVIRFIQDATGSRTLPATFGCNFKFNGGTQPVLSTAASAIDALIYNCISTSYCIASLLTNVN
jgi:hypothetical protein